MTTTDRTRWVRAEIKIVDVDEGKVPGQYNDAILSEQTVLLPLRGTHATVVALDELGRSLRTMVDQAERVHPQPKPEPDAPMTADVEEQKTAVATAADVDDIPF